MPVDRRERRAGGTRRTAVLESAARVLAERGYENTRYTDVSEASGVAVSTLQNYFGSREDMLIDTLRHATEVELLALDTLASAVVDPWNRLIALIDRNLNTPVYNHELLIEFWRAGIRDAEMREYAQDHWACYRAPFLKTVVEGCDQGAFSPALSPEDIVDLLLGALAGAMVPRVLQFPAPAADRFRTALLNQLAEMLGRTGYRERSSGRAKNSRAMPSGSRKLNPDP
ncbi:TetR/AcrR family transcriptional regulator [Mycobacterium sp. URHB0021]|jgi:AcrR family transcriptional regulator